MDNLYDFVVMVNEKMQKRKITTGFVIQTYNDKGKCIEQEFIADGYGVDYEDQDGNPVDAVENEEYQTFDMVQPQTMAAVLVGNLSDGYGVVGPFERIEDALIWSEGHESWCMTMQNPHVPFDEIQNEPAFEIIP